MRPGKAWMVAAVLAMGVGSAAGAAKTSDILNVSRAEDARDGWTAAEGSGTEYAEKTAPAVAETGWVKLSFAAGKDGELLFRVPRPAFKPGDWSTYLKIAAEKNVWLGYEKLNVVVYNPSPRPVQVGVLVEDLTGFIAGMFPTQEQTRRGQMYRVAVEVAPGASTIHVAVDGKLRTQDDQRWLDVRDVRTVGFAVKAPAADTVLYVKRMYLESSRPDAGTVNWPAEAKPCPNCAKGTEKLEPWYAELGKKGFNDANAAYCPFCGGQLKERPPEPESAPGALRIIPSARAGVTTATGGSGDTGTCLSRPQMFWELHHYMEYTWEARGFLRFSLEELPAGARIKTAQLRLFSALPSKGGKPWFPPLRIYSIPDQYDDWTRQVTWLSQPPVGNLLVQGGLYRWRDDPIQWFSYDVTPYVAQQAAGRRVASLALYVMTPYPARMNPHPLGHCIRYGNPPENEAGKQPYLYVELAGN